MYKTNILRFLTIIATFAICHSSLNAERIVKEYKAKKDDATQLWGYENKGDKEYWWEQAHSQGDDEELMNCNYEINWLISPQYTDVAKEFEEGLAAVEINGKVGFIDKNNRFVIAPKFEPMKNLKGFSQGLAAVKIGDKYGYIDKTGKFIIEPQFDYAENFNENHLATVKMGKKYGAIDLFGDTVVPCKFIAEEAMTKVPFSNKPYRQAAKDAKNRYEDGYYDDVNMAIQEAENTINRKMRDNSWRLMAKRNLVTSTRNSNKGLKANASDTAWVIQPNYTTITPLDKAGEYFAVTTQTGTGVYDCYGRMILPCSFKKIMAQEKEQIFVVYRSDNRAGLYSYSGSLIVPTSFESISSFTNGTATASIEGVNTSIDVNGQVSDDFINQLLPLGLQKTGADFSGFYKRIADIRPTCAQAHNNLGIHAITIEDNKTGMNQLKIAHKLDPNDQQIEANLKQAKSDRNDRRWKRIGNILEITAAVIGIATTTYAATQGVSLDPAASYSTVGASSYDMTSSSDYSSSSSSSKSKRSKTDVKKNECGSNWMSDSRVYSNYEDQLIQMKTFPEKYDASQYKEIQRKMRNIRKKWEARGCTITKSSHE